MMPRILVLIIPLRNVPKVLPGYTCVVEELTARSHQHQAERPRAVHQADLFTLLYKG